MALRSALGLAKRATVRLSGKAGGTGASASTSRQAGSSAGPGGAEQDKCEGVAGKRFCVVGGGIAGMSAAWNLRRCGAGEVVLHERKPTVGGNVKTHRWAVPGAEAEEGSAGAGSDETVQTGVAVLAWPTHVFHNYTQLMRHLDIPFEEHDMRYTPFSLLSMFALD